MILAIGLVWVDMLKICGIFEGKLFLTILFLEAIGRRRTMAFAAAATG